MQSLFTKNRSVVTLILVLLATASLLVGVAYATVVDGPWSPMGYGFEDYYVYALAADPDGTIYAGGDFEGTCDDINCTTDTPAFGVAQWDGSSWSPVGFGLPDYVYALAVAKDGTLYAGGNIDYFCGDSDCTFANRIAGANNIVQWDGSSWSSVGFGLNGEVNALAVGSDGTLYAGGSFSGICTDSGCTSETDTNYIVQWDGSSWSSVGYGFEGDVLVLAAGPDGTLYAGGEIYRICMNGDCTSKTDVNYIAQWDGSSWSQINFGLDYEVYSLAVGPDGDLYAGGYFDGFCLDSGCTTATTDVNHIAKWDGSSWSTMDFGFFGEVLALAARPDGTVYAGGDTNTLCGDSACTSALKTTFNWVAQWDGSSWSTAGYGLDAYIIYALTTNSAGRLYAGGDFRYACGDSDCTSANDIRVNHVAMALPDQTVFLPIIFGP